MIAASNPAPGLFVFLANAKVIGEIHGVPIETVILFELALASTVAGDLIFTKPTGAPEWGKAKVSLLLTSGDAEMHWWARSSAEGLLAAQEAVLSHKDLRKSTEKVVAGLEEKKRIMSALGHGQGTLLGKVVPDPAMLIIDERIRIAKVFERYRHLRRVNERRCHPAPVNGYTCSLLARGKGDYSAILRSRDRCGGSGAALALPGANRSTIVGWLSERDLRPVAQLAGTAWFCKLGWILATPVANGSGTSESRLAVPVERLFEKVELMRLTETPFKFTPHPVARDFLDRQVEEIIKVTARFLSGQNRQAVPDPHLAWHLGALLAAISGEITNSAVAMTLCCKLGAFLASRLVRHHVHWFRQLFPADKYGEFVELDLAILRSLTSRPQKVRDIQRRLRDISKTRCLITLHRACDAELAVCVDGERFANALSPPPGLGVSDFLSGMDAVTAFPD